MEITSLDELTEPEQKARRYLQQLAPHVSNREGAEIIRGLLTVVDNLRFNVHKVIQQRTRWDKVATMEKEANALLIAENRRLRKNAERYEWLRMQNWTQRGLFVVSANDKDVVRLGTNCPTEERLDDAIDAEIAKHGANHEQG